MRALSGLYLQAVLAKPSAMSADDLMQVVKHYGVIVGHAAAADEVPWPCSFNGLTCAKLVLHNTLLCENPNAGFTQDATEYWRYGDNIEKLYDVDIAKKMMLASHVQGDAKAWIAGTLYDAYVAFSQATVTFVIMHEIGHVVNGDLESDDLDTEIRSDETSANLIGEAFGDQESVKIRAGAMTFLLQLGSLWFAGTNEDGRAQFLARIKNTYARLGALSATVLARDDIDPGQKQVFMQMERQALHLPPDADAQALQNALSSSLPR